MKNKNWIAIVLIVVLSIFGYNYLYQDHREISNEKADFSVSSTVLQNDFLNNIKTAEAKYLNKVIVVTGEVSEINPTDITLNTSIFCGLLPNTSLEKINLNNSITIKGRCIGFDDLLEQVKLDQCTITN